MTRSPIEARSLSLAAFAVAAVACAAAAAQMPATSEKATFAGAWKGESVCQIKESPCHNELAAYYIEKGTERDAYRMRLYKVVNGVEELMGTLDCRSDTGGDVLTCQNEATVWTWRLAGDSISGTAIFHGALYRKISLTRAKQVSTPPRVN